MARWIEILSAYDFIIEYKRGSKQSHADALNRCEHPADCTCPEVDISEPLKCGPCKKCRKMAQEIEDRNENSNMQSSQTVKPQQKSASEDSCRQRKSASKDSGPQQKSTSEDSGRQHESTAEDSNRHQSLHQKILVDSKSRHQKILDDSKRLHQKIWSTAKVDIRRF